MLAYVVTEDDTGIQVGSYLSREIAVKYNGSATIHEDIIMSEDVGFPLPGLIVRGYARKDGGTYATKSLLSPDNDLLLFARSEQDEWVLVSSPGTGGMSKVRNQYAECVLLDFQKPSKAKPREVIPKLNGQIVSIAPERTTHVRTSGVYDM